MISFVICTNGKKVELTKLLIQTIFNTAGSDADIHLGGVITDFTELADRVKLHDFSYEANNGCVGALRNKTITCTTGDIIAYCDDDVLYPTYWYNTFLKYNELNPTWQVLTNKIYLPNGGRYWDRAIVDYDTHTMIDYNHDKTDKRLFFCATSFQIKREVFEKNKFDDNLLYYGGYANKDMPFEQFLTAEDLELSNRLYKNGYVIDFDVNNTVYHAAWNFIEIIRPNNENFRNVCVQEQDFDINRDYPMFRYHLKKEFDDLLSRHVKDPNKFGNNDHWFVQVIGIRNIYINLLNREPSVEDISQLYRAELIKIYDNVSHSEEFLYKQSLEYKMQKINAKVRRLR